MAEARPYATTVCPYCSLAVDPLPKAKKRCPHCGRPIYVRSGPDGYRYLLQEVDLPVLEAAWAEYHEREEYRRRVAAYDEDFDELEAELQRKDPRYTAHDVWWRASNRRVLDALKRGDWFEAETVYRDQARDLFDRDKPWVDIARAGFKMELRRMDMELRQIGEAIARAEVLACPCMRCQRDNGRVTDVRTEVSNPLLPHDDCLNGWCSCDYSPVIY